MLIPAERGRFYRNNFDAIRLAMALLVVFSHSFALRFGTEDFEPMSLATNGHYNSGNVGVWVFFVISGFLIAHSHERSTSIGSYAAKRIRRIYPAYLVATSACAFLVTPLFAPPGWSLTAAEAARTIGANLLLANHFPIPDLFAGNPVPAVNGALWSIRFEFLCYIGVALSGLVALRLRRHVLPLVYVAIVLTWCWLDVTGRKPGGPDWLREAIGWPYAWFRVLPNFLAGMIVYHWRAHIPRSTALLAALLAGALLGFHLGGHRPAGLIAAHLLGPPAIAYAVFWLAYHPRIDLSRAARFGDFSYGTYLYAYTIQQMLVATTALPFASFILLSMALALGAGVASWWLVERHFLPHGRKPARHGPERKEAPAS
ncbi:acyltransferase family protein [Rhizorhabdus dicambivorans]|nr:acyltransferase [Rhizorhabdus dicambivorans]